MKKEYLWKAMQKNLKSAHGRVDWKIGKWQKIKGDVSICDNGFHASEKILDSMAYVNMGCLAKVEVRGFSVKQSDKQCWSEMRIVKAWKWEKKDSVALAVYAASLVLENFEKVFPDDKRPREAIQAAKNWLKNPTEENRTAAESAAESARSAVWSARSAARPARSAAESAVWSARSAVWSARSAAESAAESAAWSAALDKIETWIKRRTSKLEAIEKKGYGRTARREAKEKGIMGKTMLEQIDGKKFVECNVKGCSSDAPSRISTRTEWIHLCRSHADEYATGLIERKDLDIDYYQVFENIRGIDV